MAVEEIKSGAAAGTLGDEMEDNLIAKGIGSRKDGKFTIDDEKLQKQAGLEEHRKILARDHILSDGYSGIQQAIENAEKGKKAAEEDLNTKVLKELNNSLGTNSQVIAKALNELNQSLRSFSGGG